MKVYLKDIVGTLPDNDLMYFKVLEGLLNSHDEQCECEVRKTTESYFFRIVLTLPDSLEDIIEHLNLLHTSLNLRVDYSKSMKKTSSISWKLYL